MNDYIYGYRSMTGALIVDPEYLEEYVRAGYGDRAISVLLSAIEPLPAPKPVLPTTPGSVVMWNRQLWMLDESHRWVRGGHSMSPGGMSNCSWLLEHDAGEVNS